MRNVCRLAATALATSGLVAGGLTFAGAPAFASLGHRLLSRITEAPAEPGVVKSGPFHEIFAMTVDLNDVYVYDRNGNTSQGLVDEFNSAGGFVSQFDDGVVVQQDGRSIAANEATGEVYIAANPGNLREVYVFSAAGQPLGSWNGEGTPGGLFGNVPPVAVDNSTNVADPDRADVYVSASNKGVGAIDVFEAGGKEKYLFQLSKSLGSVSLGAIDQANGDLYVDVEGGTDVLEPEAGGEYKLLQHFTGFEARAVDSVDGDMYANGVDEFNSAGVQIGELTGTTAGSLQEPVPFGAVNGFAPAPNEDVYVAEAGAVDVFGPNIVFPDVATGGFSLPSVQQTAATVQGTVNPEGIAGGTTYFFQYGTTEALGSSTPFESAGEGSNAVPVSVNLNGLEEDTTYYYRLVVDAEGEHHFGAIHHVTTLPAAPTIYLALQTTATVQGTVDTQDLPTSYWVEYGPSVAYGQTTPEVSVKGSLEGVAVAQIIDELLPLRTYHYRLVSKNALGITYSADGTVTTTALTPPTVSTGGASGVSQNSATLSGAVDTNSLQTEYGFEIATESGDYGPATGLGGIGGAFIDTVTVTLGELQPGTTYYYRVTATNADGTSYGEAQMFTTPGFPDLLTVPTPPPLLATPDIAFPSGSQENTGTPVETKRPTNGQKLSKALRVCRRERKKVQRATCERQAHKRYGRAGKAAKGARKYR